MSFLSPWWLLLLLPVAALAIAYVVAQRRRERYAVRFATQPMLARLAPARPGWRRHLPAAVLLAAMALLALGTARPQVDVQVPRERATIIVAIDVSRSMDATDITPSRIEAAQNAAAEFVRALPATFNVGLVSFSGTTSVLATPSTDRTQVLDRLQTLRLADATAIGEGVFTSLDQIATLSESTGPPGDSSAPDAPSGPGDPADPGQPAQTVPARIVLLSDGTNTRGRSPQEAAAAAAQAQVPVSTIAYGTPEGAIQVGGRLVQVPVDEVSLAALADATGGQAYTARSDTELSAVYDDIGSSIGWQTESRELTPYLSAAALLLAIVAALLSLRWFARLP